MTAGHALIIGNTDGIGLALTRKLLALGWTVTGVSRRSPVVEAPGFHGAVADVAAAGYRPALEALHGQSGSAAPAVHGSGRGLPR